MGFGLVAFLKIWGMEIYIFGKIWWMGVGVEASTFAFVFFCFSFPSFSHLGAWFCFAMILCHVKPFLLQRV